MYVLVVLALYRELTLISDLIHYERNSPDPFSSRVPKHDQRTLEDLIKIGLQEYVHERVLGGLVPSDDDLIEEARTITRKSDDFLVASGGLEPSWFRDLILGSEGRDYNDLHLENTGEENLLWIQEPGSTTKAQPLGARDITTINCRLERSLMKWIVSHQMLGLTPQDSQLQVEACRVLNEVEATSNFKCQAALKWFKWLVTADTKWLCGLRRRACLPRSSDIADESVRPTDESVIDFAVNNLDRLTGNMVEWATLQKAQDIIPTDEEIQSYARLMVYNSDDPWNQTVMDDPGILYLFKQQQGIAPTDDVVPIMPSFPEPEVGIHSATSPSLPPNLHWDLEGSNIPLPSPMNSGSGTGTPSFRQANPFSQSPNTATMNQPTANSNPVQPLKYFLNDANCYGRLVRELSRFVTSCMSLNNPNCHVGSLAIVLTCLTDKLSGTY
jgi:hypothetical protein